MYYVLHTTHEATMVYSNLVSSKLCDPEISWLGIGAHDVGCHFGGPPLCTLVHRIKVNLCTFSCMPLVCTVTVHEQTPVHLFFELLSGTMTQM